MDDVDTDVKCVITKDNIILNVGFPKVSKDSIIVSGKIGLQPYEQDIPRLTKKDVLYDLEIVFLQMNLDFNVDTNNNIDNEISISDMQIQKTVFFDGLSKDRLFDIMVSIFNCMNFLRMKFNLLEITKSI